MTHDIDIGSLTHDQAVDLVQHIREKFNGIPAMRARGSDAGRPPGTDYASWDWTKKNKELAAEHGVNYVTVCKWRNRLGQPRARGGKHYPACLSWDWEKSDTEISRETSVAIGVIKGKRRDLGKPLHPRDSQKFFEGMPKRVVLDFSAVDWNKADVEIARELGCTREFVRRKRAQGGHPKSKFYLRQYERFVAEFKGKEISFADAQAKFPKLCHVTFKRYCHKAEIKVSTNQRQWSYPWNEFDWRLPNALLATIWYGDTGTIANWRGQHPVIGRALFHSMKGSVPEEFKDLVAAQREKASAWMATKNGAALFEERPS